MNKGTYLDSVKNKEITDCVIVKKDFIAFAMKEYQTIEGGGENSISENRTTQIFAYAPSLIDINDGYAKTIEYYKGVDQFKVTYNEKLIVLSTLDFRVEEKEDDTLLEVIPDDFYTREITAMRTIDGVTYATGLFHKVFMRKAIHHWVDITDPEKHANLFWDLKRRREAKGNIGGANSSFHTIDGFSNSDIYAGGDKGDCWHYNGELWKVIDLPTNFDIKTITCASDGHVYIGGHNSSGILKGRGDRWELICITDEMLQINDSAWFQGKLYLSDNYALYFLEEDELKIFEFPEGEAQQHSFARVTAVNDIMVAYGGVQALMFDGKKCKEIIGIPELDQSE